MEAIEFTVGQDAAWVWRSVKIKAAGTAGSHCWSWRHPDHTGSTHISAQQHEKANPPTR